MHTPRPHLMKTERLKHCVLPCGVINSCLDNIVKFRLLQPDLDTTTLVVYRSESVAVERPHLHVHVPALDCLVFKLHKTYRPYSTVSSPGSPPPSGSKFGGRREPGDEATYYSSTHVWHNTQTPLRAHVHVKWKCDIYKHAVCILHVYAKLGQ